MKKSATICYKGRSDLLILQCLPAHNLHGWDILNGWKPEPATGS